MTFGSEFGCLGLENQAFRKGGIEKNDLRRNWISYYFRVQFSFFRVALGLIFMTFAALQTVSKIDELSCDSRVIADPESRSG